MHPLFLSILKSTFALIAKFPLAITHKMGAVIGYITFYSSKKHANLMRANLRNSKLFNDEASYQHTLKENISESGKAIIETFAIWFRQYEKLKPWMQQCTGWEHVTAAKKRGKGIIFLTPHLGCFEITSIYYGQFDPITVLYRPPRQAWLKPIIQSGRERKGVTLAPANAKGVKQLIQALKRGEAIGILPDQAPLEGEGEWVNFFNRPAYTMTLACKLAKKSGAQVLMAFGERLENGQGYHIHIKPVADGNINTPALLNTEIEKAIASCPSQYAWFYDRYKVRGASAKKLETKA